MLLQRVTGLQGYRVRSSHSPAHNPLCESCSAGVTLQPWLGFWDAGNVSIRALLLWDDVKQISDSVAVISAGPRCSGWQTEPDWTTGHFPPSARLLWCLLNAPCRQLVLFCVLACSTLLYQTTQIWKKCTGRFKFSQECGPSEHPPSPSGPLSTWETLLWSQSPC